MHQIKRLDNNNFGGKYLVTSLWSLWIVFLIFVSFETRYWINHDVIGSLDSARYFCNLQLKEGFNSYWGIGYPLFLVLLPLNKINSWLQIHLFIALLVLISQLLIYNVLLYLNVNKVLSTILCIIWGTTNYSTGGGLFITADVPLCFMGSIFLFVAVKLELEGKLIKPASALLLGTIHGVAWITKAIALPGLICFPCLLFLRELLERNSYRRGIIKLYQGSLFIILYLLPLIIIIGLWTIGSYSKYGRLSLSEASAYNYALKIENSSQLMEGQLNARYDLPKYGTFWWSDIGLSISGWDHKINFNLYKQLKRTWSSVIYFFTSFNIRDGCVIILLILLSIIGFIKLSSNMNQYSFLIILTATGCFIVMIYSSVLLLARYLVFPLIFFMPACGVVIEQVFQREKKITKIIILFILSFSLVHGLSSMAYASIFLAPGGEHFAVAEKLKHTNSHKPLGPIGAFLGKHDYVYHHGVIGYLLNVQTAEIKFLGTDKSHFIANFTPNTVIIAASPQEQAPPVVVVNNRKYGKMYSYMWGKDFKKTQLIIYR